MYDREDMYNTRNVFLWRVYAFNQIFFVNIRI